MGEDKDKLPKISLQDIFWNVLLGWRKILLICALFVVLGCGAKYLQVVKTANIKEIIPEESKTEIVSEIEDLELQIDRAQKYVDNSILLKINPYEENIAVFQYYVDSDYRISYLKEQKRDYTDDLISLYHRYITSGEFRQQIIDRVGLNIQPEYLGELIKVEENASSICISFIYPDKKHVGKK